MTIALGVLVGTMLAARWADRRYGLAAGPVQNMAMILAVAGFVGGRLFYVLEEGGPLLGTTGFTFNGGFIAAAVALVAYVWWRRLDVRYLDAVALWLPLGVAVGRVGDVINGEHYGARSDAFYAVRNSHPDALTPDSSLAYVNGGLLEVMLGLVVFAVMLIVHRRFSRPGELVPLVLVLLSVGRFGIFFLRDDSPELVLGLSNAQWTSVGVVVATLVAWALWRRWAGPVVAEQRRG